MEETTPILTPPEAVPQLTEPKCCKGHKKIVLHIVIIVILLIAFGAIFCCGRGDLTGNKKVWKAVFLTNGQVYFGKVISESKKAITMHEIYYLQVTQLTPQTKEDQQQEPQLTLIKLGQELHGPTDEMRINRDHVLFVETLKPDSQVVQTIEGAKNKE